MNKHFGTILAILAVVLSAEIARGEAVDFERDVQPILTRFGCNAGACHGKSRGQNGFQLSLLGFDPQFDHDALTREARGRRIFLPEPSRSLFLQKPTGEIPHGGGKRIEKNSEAYQILLSWIEQGMARRVSGTPKLVNVVVSPEEQILGYEKSFDLKVMAHYSDGSSRDVTQLSAYQSNESAIAGVNDQGQVKTNNIVGDAAVMVRYLDQIGVCSVAVPQPGTVPDAYYEKLPQQNFIDGHVWSKLQKLRITPSEPAPDHKFLRRVYLDIIGRIPTLEETQQFLSDHSPDKREKLIDHLLEQPEYADHWANKWADLLRPNPYHVGIKATLNYDAWIREQFRRNRPWDMFVTDLITAQGSTFKNGAVTMFRDRRTPDDLTTVVSQLFLGVRLECAKCHHHPFERWGQDDFYGFAAYFAKVGRKGRGISAPISGSEELIYATNKGEVKHPLTGEVLVPKTLFGKTPIIPEGSDPRRTLAAWMTSKENPYFAQVMANRIWADLMGRGLVEPVDDLRATNPASNAALLNALSEDFQKHDYDLKKLIRRIATSYVYGLSSHPTERNVTDTRNYSRYYRQRMRAEVFVDAIVDITGISESFAAMPPDSSAKRVWTRRVSSLTLDAFGRPDPNQDPPCERTTDTSIVQALHLMNSDFLSSKILSDKGRAALLAASEKLPTEIIEELYLRVYSRPPTEKERTFCETLYAKPNAERRMVTEDILWAMINSAEFLFKD